MYLTPIRSLGGLGRIAIALVAVTVCGSSARAMPGAQLLLATTVVAAGSSGDASITYRSQGAAVSGLQCDLATDQDVLITAATTGSAGLTADKSVQTALLPNGNLRVILVGFNETIIPDGDVIDLKVQVRPSAAAGRHVLRCNNVVAVTANGEETEVDVHQGRVISVSNR